jgi:Mg2+-importing ATPase
MLSTTEARARLAACGPNVIVGGRRWSWPRQIFAKLRNPLLLLLLAASTVSGLTGDLRSFTVIAVMALLSLGLDLVQERRAGRAAERLRQTTVLRATVVRDGQPQEIPSTEVVPGDLVLLTAGDLVPADATIEESRDLFVNQTLLTGETYPVEKQPSAGPSSGSPEDRAAVLMGTSVISGSGKAVVVQTGPRTMLGQIGVSLVREPPPTVFERGTRSFGLLILRVALGMVLFVILVNTIRGRPALESFLFGVALAVGLTPELLPMVVSVCLARGALRMAAKRVLVKRLSAIHDLGSIDVLCTDKTGTLTEARIRLEKHLDPRGNDSLRVLELIYLNSRFESGLRSPLDEAILRHEEVDVSAWTKLDEVPFDFERRRVSVLARRGDEPPLLIVKGAFEDVLALSTSYEGVGGLEVMDSPARARMQAQFEALGRDGLRVLGVAWKEEAAGCCHAVISDETTLVFAGFAAFEDPPKASAPAALRDLAALGISVKIITGDNELLAQKVCRDLGFASGDVLSGADIAALDYLALQSRVEEANLFCRVNPAQKSRIIAALKARGHAVAFLGDGINDAPSLHAADVGISVDSAADIAKEASDLILLEKDLSVLREGVVEGRRTLGNILKYVLMGTSSNFGNMLSMAAAAVFLPFLPMLPMQILVNNFLYDLSEVPIPMDDVDEEYIRRPHRWDMGFVKRFMMTIGPVSSLFDLATFFLLLRVLGANERLFQTGWFVESLATQVLVIFVIRTSGSALRSRPARLLVATSLLVVAVAFALPFTPLGPALGFVRPPAIFFAMLFGMVAAYLVAVESVKRWFYRRVFAGA